MSEKQKKLRHGNGGDDTDHRGKLDNFFSNVFYVDGIM